MKLPVVNKELAFRLEQAEIGFFTSRITSMGERAGNPMGVEIRRFGNATAFYIKEMPWPLYHTVKGMSAGDIGELEAILGFYRGKDRAFQMDINPAVSSPGLLRRLAELGLFQRDFHSVLYGLPLVQAAPLPGNITILEVEDEALFDTYAEIHCLGSGMSINDKVHFVNNNRGLLHRPGWRLFLAFREGQAAAVAAMHIQEGIASCALAATLPSFRRRGLQSALLQRRMYEAHKTGCELVTAQADYGSSSQNNMERAGLQMAWTRAVWASLIWG